MSDTRDSYGCAAWFRAALTYDRYRQVRCVSVCPKCILGVILDYYDKSEAAVNLEFATSLN